MSNRVQIEIGGNIVVDADTSKAEEKLRNLPKAVPDVIGHGGKPQDSGIPAPTPPANINPLNNLNPAYFESMAQRAAMSVMSSMGTARTDTQFRALGDRLERALFNAQQSGNKELVGSIEDLRDALKQQKHAADQARIQNLNTGYPNTNRSGGTPNGGGGGMNTFLDQGKKWLGAQAEEGALGGLTRYLGGNVGSMLMGGLGKLMGGPLGWIAGGFTAANYAFNAVSNAVTENNAQARNEAVGYADLARQYGSDQDFMSRFRSRTGWTNDRFAMLGYSATQASHVAALYDRPGGMMNDTEDILKFSRTTGMDESRMAGVSRTFGLVGIGGTKGGNVGEGLRTLKLAMSEGIKDGIASSDTMNSLLGIAQKAQSEGRSMNTSGLAYYAQITGRFNKFENASMHGQNAANLAQGFLSGLGNQSDPGMEYFLLKSLGNLPSAKKLGLKGEEATGYDMLLKESPIEAGRSLLKLMQRGDNPAIAQQLFESIDKASGGSAVLKKYMYQQLYPGASDEQLNSLIGGGGLGNVYKSDKKGLAIAQKGQDLLDDKQHGNNFANDTMYLRVAESDRDMIKSLANLRLTGGLEKRIAELKGSIVNFTSSVASLFALYGNANGSYQGKLGEGWKSPNTIDPAVVAANPDNSASVTRDGPLNGKQRLFAAIAAQESNNGTNKDMNADYIKVNGQMVKKSAKGLYQMQPKNLIGPDGWAKEAGVNMTLNGKPVTSEADAKSWMIQNPVEANKIAESRLGKVNDLVSQVYKSNGVELPENVRVQLVAALWHKNGGGNLAAFKLPITDKRNPLNMMLDPRTGGLSTNTLLLNPKGVAGGAGDSDRAYAQSVASHYSNPNLAPADSGTGNTVMGIPTPGSIVGEKAISEALGLAGRGGGTPYGQTYKEHSEWGVHVGEDLFAKQGTKVFAPFSGYVKLRPKDPGQGNVIDIFDAKNQRMSLIHLQKYADGLAEAVKKSNGKLFVQKGDLIGYVGRTGSTAHATADGSNDHLHITAVNARGEIVNPYEQKYFDVPTPKGYKKGFRTGGYTGDGPRDGEAGVVHHEEWVVDAATTARHKQLLAGLTPTGGAPTQKVEINLGGTLQINAQISAATRGEINSAFDDFQRRVQSSLTTEYTNQRGFR